MARAKSRAKIANPHLEAQHEKKDNEVQMKPEEIS
jgi:hypothetical protein